MVERKRILLSSVIAFFVLSGTDSVFASDKADADTLTLSLDQCIAIALSDNPTVKIADMEVTRVDYSKKETIGQLLPAISFGGSYNRMIAKQVAYMNMKGFGSMGGSSEEDVSTQSVQSRADGSQESGDGGRKGIKMGLDNSYQAGFNASMPLIAPQLWASLKLNDSQILQNIEAARASRLSLINQVKNAYYSLLLAEDSHKVILENYDNAVFNNEIYKKKFQVGTATEYEVLRSSVQVKNVEPELVQSQIAISQAQMQLAILMGMDTAIPIKATATLKEYEKDMYDTVMAIDESIDRNTDLRSLDIQTKNLENALRIQKMSWFPTLSLSAGYNWTSSSDGNPLRNFLWTPYSMIGLTLSIPIFEGGQRYHKINRPVFKLTRWRFNEKIWSVI